ncbi:actin-binding LIM protein 1 isoform X3 [Strongylocentrotus purpuratus]|uniref:Actin-binding LIM protein 1 n=1 Tax=Strongylocentrotus purpuratus TaxID=7668 RepID=A0A7M7NU29_STRPU|nr:actin-binding LIM protein 1 isoform X3 [Strongylocentrotus purpuratus]
MAVVQKSGGFFFVDYASGSDSVCDSVFEDDRGDDVDDDDEEEVCSAGLGQGGFFIKNGKYYCAADYQDNYGTKCKACGQYLEGEVVTALGNTYHKYCFVCARCGHSFVGGEDVSYDPVTNCCLCLQCQRITEATGVALPPGEKVTYDGKDVMCDACNVPGSSNDKRNRDVQIKANGIIPEKARETSSAPGAIRCAQCNDDITQGQALVALDKHWHVWCFKCHKCKKVLTGEYMGRDGQPFCERDFHQLFGVRCSRCDNFITGKVLEAGDHKYHPTCAKCGRCGNHFNEGEDMFVQGTEIWHPDCRKGRALGFFPSRIRENAILFDYNRGKSQSTPASPVLARGHFHTPSFLSSPSRRSSNSLSPQSPDYSYTYLSPFSISNTIYPKPVAISPEAPVSPHFHRPEYVNNGEDFSYMSPPRYDLPPPRPGGYKRRPRPHSAFDALKPKIKPVKDEALSAEMVRQSKFPAAKKPSASQPAKIESEIWPGPPAFAKYQFHSSRSKSMGDLHNSDEEEEKQIDAEVSKVDSALGKEILKAELKQRKISNLDPRSASRTPAANKELPVSPRHESSMDAENMMTPPRSSTLPPNLRYESLSEAYRKASSLPMNARSGSWYSDANSEGYISNGYASSGELSPRLANMNDRQLRTLRITTGQSMPSMEPKVPKSSTKAVRIAAPKYKSTPKGRPGPVGRRSKVQLYPLEVLRTTNYRLPKDVDRKHLEYHLSNEDFFRAFGMTFEDFHALSPWKRTVVKKNALLF